MKKVLLISLLIWIIVINLGKIFPTSRGEKYYRNLQKWYLLANKGEWGKAEVISKNLKKEDIEDFSKKNKSEELTKRLNEITIRSNKNADDWMEIAVLLYKLGNKEEAYKAIELAHKIDPIREDINKIYFTYRNSLLFLQLP